jgi:hypothetical protein
MLALVAIILDIALGAYSIFDLKKGGEWYGLHINGC